MLHQNAPFRALFFKFRGDMPDAAPITAQRLLSDVRPGNLSGYGPEAALIVSAERCSLHMFTRFSQFCCITSSGL